MIARIHWNAMATGLANLTPIHAAVSDSDGRGDLVIRKDDVAIVAVQESAGGEMSIRTLASLLAEAGFTAIHGLKIDIEGHEDRALVPFLDTCPPAMRPRRIVIEHPEPQADYPGCTAAFARHGYRLNKVVEFDDHGKVAWSVSNDDLSGKPFADPCGCQRLPNGNTVIASYGAQKGVKLFEITRDKQVVWKYEGPHRVHHFQILTTNGTPIAGRPLR